MVAKDPAAELSDMDREGQSPLYRSPRIHLVQPKRNENQTVAENLEGPL
jgi:hypothetical protein